MKNDLKIFTSEQLSHFDFAELIMYSIFLYICGIAGDSFDQKKILTLAYIGLATCFALLGLPGALDWYNQPYFIVIMMFIGTLNALLWPCFISIIASWFPKKTRGFVAGLWATCNNSGNIVGIQLGTGLLNVYDDWWWLLFTIAIITFVWALVIWIFLIPEPEMVGIVIEEYTEKEALIVAAVDNQVYDRVIARSVHDRDSRVGSVIE